MIDESYQFVIPGRGRQQPRQRFMVLWPKEDRLADGRSIFGICRKCAGDLTCRKCTKRKPFLVPHGLKRGDPLIKFREDIKRAVRRGFKKTPLDGPLDFLCTFIFPRPQAIVWKRKPMPRRWHISTPDFDNLAKAVSDALKDIIWKDDRFVARSTIEKFVAAGDERPMVLFEIGKLDPENTESLWCDDLIKKEMQW